MKTEIKKITDYIFLKSKPQKADLLIVFGTRHKEAIYKTHNLYRNGLASKILVSGGLNRITKENEAKRMSDGLIKLGVNKKDIILENKSSNSLENVLFSRKIIKEKLGFENIRKIMVVVKHYHSRRALMTMKKHFPKWIKIFPITYEIYDFNRNNWFKKEETEKKVLSEWIKIKKYLEKGDIEELD
jgi:uncharacterized SAM-binding protein YcdF (DUF218 family)